MGDGFVEIEHQSGHERVRGQFRGCFEFAGVFGMFAVVGQSAVEFALEHRKLFCRRFSAQNGLVEHGEPFFGFRGQHSLREPLRGFHDGLVIEQGEGLEWCVGA